ncbi:hypothetical protein LINGRAPRIM_LOCUS1317 [Linum grandiflorum]
MALPLGYYCH